MNLRKKSTREEFERALAQCKPEDFDGHTEFYRLTPRAKARMVMSCSSLRLRVQRQSKSCLSEPTETTRLEMVSKVVCLLFGCSCS